MELTTVKIEKPENTNFILGQSHFIKTVEDMYEALITTVPGIKFGLAFCEASGACLVRWAGTDQPMIELAQKNAMQIGAGHSFILFLGDGSNQYIEHDQDGAGSLPDILCDRQLHRSHHRRYRRWQEHPRRGRWRKTQGHRRRSRHYLAQEFPAHDWLQIIRFSTAVRQNKPNLARLVHGDDSGFKIQPA